MLLEGSVLVGLVKTFCSHVLSRNSTAMSAGIFFSGSHPAGRRPPYRLNRKRCRLVSTLFPATLLPRQLFQYQPPIPQMPAFPITLLVMTESEMSPSVSTPQS